MAGLGQYFTETLRETHGSHRTFRYAIACSPDFVRDAALAVASAYVPRSQAAAHPSLTIERKLPTAWKIRLGDFTEIMTRSLLEQRHGRQLPLHKLHLRAAPNATIQGPDHLSVLLASPLEAPIPELIECKGRTGRLTASGVLTKELKRELGAIDSLDSSWLDALRELENMPHPERIRARHLAHQFAYADPDSTVAQLERHVVVLCEDDGIDAETFWSSWPDEWPAADLFIVTLADLKASIGDVFAAAGRHRFGDVVDLGTKAFESGVLDRADVGYRAPADASAVTLKASGFVGPTRLVAESALWMLADYDGMGLAAAAEALRKSPSTPVMSALAALLSGGIPDDDASVSAELTAFMDAVKRAWKSPDHPYPIVAAGDALAATIADEGERMVVRLCATAIAYRLSRHPLRMLPAPFGERTTRVLGALARRRIRALWPGQCHAIEAGWLNSSSSAFVLEMPTSAGKTTLIELLAARSLDAQAGTVVVVLCPTRALVDQQRQTYAESFGADRVVGLHGGYDVDATDADLEATADIIVMTPERFDRELRLSEDDDRGLLQRIAALVVDEAQMLDQDTRGARLELLLSTFRDLTGARISLISSHLGEVASMLRWLHGDSDAFGQSDWRPTPLRRGVFYPGDGYAYVRWDHDWETAQQLFEIRPREGTHWTEPDLFGGPTLIAGASSAAQLTAASIWAQDQGMTMVAVTKRRSVLPTARRVAEAALPPQDPAALAQLAARLDPLDPDAADLLRRGVGMHRRGLPPEVLRVVEEAARAGLLSFVVCTPTLADGVDFPIRTVVISGLQIDRGVKLDARRITNLAGRAGRAGRFRDGTVLIRAKDQAAANDVRRKVLGRVPPTKSALFKLLRVAAEAAEDGAIHRNWIIPDAFILETLTDAALNDHQLLERFEQLLGRTLWRAQMDAELPPAVVAGLVKRAQWIQRVAPDRRTRRVYRQTGLSFASCHQITEMLRDDAAELVATIRERATRRRLLDLAANVLWEHHSPIRGIDAEQAADWADEWASGVPEPQLSSAAGAELWHQMRAVLDHELPWHLSGVIELLAHTARPADEQFRSDLHISFDTARYRYGAPVRSCCNLIRAGHDRQVVLRLYSLYMSHAADRWAFAAGLDWFEPWASQQIDQLPDDESQRAKFMELLADRMTSASTAHSPDTPDTPDSETGWK